MVRNDDVHHPDAATALRAPTQCPASIRLEHRSQLMLHPPHLLHRHPQVGGVHGSGIPPVLGLGVPCFDELHAHGAGRVEVGARHRGRCRCGGRRRGVQIDRDPAFGQSATGAPWRRAAESRVRSARTAPGTSCGTPSRSR